MTLAPWFLAAVDYNDQYDGLELNHDNRGPRIRELIEWAHAGREGDPYCAIGVNAMLERTGFPGTRSAGARSFQWDGGKNFIRLSGPALGAIAVFWRKSPKSGLGHVGFYVGETGDHIYVLGFNQDDGINESPFPKQGRTMGLIGYYWPKGYPLPEEGAIKYDPRAPYHEVSAV